MKYYIIPKSVLPLGPECVIAAARNKLHLRRLGFSAKKIALLNSYPSLPAAMKAAREDGYIKIITFNC